MFFGFPDEWMNPPDTKTGFVPLYNNHNHNHNGNGSGSSSHHNIVGSGGSFQGSLTDLGLQTHSFSPYSDRMGQSPVDYTTEYQR